jgi:hypothetical protein
MDWGVGPSGRERFAHALLTFMFFAPADAALAALGPGRIFSGTETFRGIALCVIRGRSGVLARSRAPDPPQRARHRPGSDGERSAAVGRRPADLAFRRDQPLTFRYQPVIGFPASSQLPAGNRV